MLVLMTGSREVLGVFGNMNLIDAYVKITNASRWHAIETKSVGPRRYEIVVEDVFKNVLGIYLVEEVPFFNQADHL